MVLWPCGQGDNENGGSGGEAEAATWSKKVPYEMQKCDGKNGQRGRIRMFVMKNTNFGIKEAEMNDRSSH